MENFAARAWAYICTYHHLEQQKEQLAAANRDEIEPTNQQEFLYPAIGRFTKDMRGHRCALPFDCELQPFYLRSTFLDTFHSWILYVWYGLYKAL